MKLYDCFIYFNEEHILDLRLNVLDKYVDKFVIAEATRDHSGKEKKLSLFKKALALSRSFCFEYQIWKILIDSGVDKNISLKSEMMASSLE